MGATGWSYFTPYQPDVDAALQALKQEVFQKGDYSRPGIELDTLGQLDFFEADEPQRDEILSEYQMEAIRGFMKRHGIAGLRERLLSLEASPKIESRDDLNVLMELSPDGTSSILDIYDLMPIRHPQKYGLYPLPDEQQATLWGTAQPTRQMIEDWQLHGNSAYEEGLYYRSEGFYVIVYKEGRPDEYYFEGASGD